jgi:ribosomal protein S18 acetylase RimI-like enzyme
MAEDPEQGWIWGLGVRRHWRRRGLALALLRHCFGALYRRGKRKVGLAMDAQNLGATRLYEKAGMHVRHQYVVYERELRPENGRRSTSLESEEEKHGST